MPRLLDWCPQCQGKGYYMQAWRLESETEYQEEERICPMCDGLGVCDERDIDRFVRVRRPDRATDASVDEPR